MARSQQPLRRKTRTREHIVGDLAVNAVERQVLLRGFSLEAIAHDYGYDGLLFTYNDQGEPEEGLLYLQIKATDTVAWVEDGATLTFRIERPHLTHWLSEPMPVVLCVYDAPADVVYWLYVQNYFQTLPGFNLFEVGQTITVRIPRTQAFTPEAVGFLAERLAQVCQQLEGKVSHA
jgi:hypothetical protein